MLPRGIFNIEQFIQNHNHVFYCEAIIHTNGSIEYAIPSHTEALIRIYGLDREALYKRIPLTESPIHWLVENTRCIAVWYDGAILPRDGKTTIAQKRALIMLRNSKIIGF